MTETYRACRRAQEDGLLPTGVQFVPLDQPWRVRGHVEQVLALDHGHPEDRPLWAEMCQAFEIAQCEVSWVNP